MMSTYELVIAFLSTDASTSSSTIEVTTIETKRVSLGQIDNEANAVNETEL